MDIWAVYNTTTGHIFPSGVGSAASCTDAMIAVLAGNMTGKAIWRGQGDPSQESIIDLTGSEPVRIPIEQADPAAIAAIDSGQLAADQAAAVNQVNARAAAILGAVASPHAAQVAIYEAKEQEAKAYQADADPDPADYPLLELGRTVEGRTLAEEAVAVLTEAAQWKQAGAAVDAVRRAANKAIGQATTRAEVQAVLDGLTWPDLGQ